MTLVDSSVWIDYFRGTSTPQTNLLDRLLQEEHLLTGDLILVEVLQGFLMDREFRAARQLLTSLPVLEIVGRETAIQAAEHYRSLRKLGITARKTIDTLIATRCIRDGVALLYSDADFEPFVRHLGLRPALIRH